MASLCLHSLSTEKIAGIVMTKKELIAASIVADVLDLFVIGQIPGMSWFVDIPVICMHVAFAGAAGLLTMFELVPVVGTIPLFTIAALAHSPKEE